MKQAPFKLRNLKCNDRRKNAAGEWVDRIAIETPRHDSDYLGEPIFRVCGHLVCDGDEPKDAADLGSRPFVSGYTTSEYDRDAMVWSSLEGAKNEIRERLLAEGKVRKKTIVVYERVRE